MVKWNEDMAQQNKIKPNEVKGNAIIFLTNLPFINHLTPLVELQYNIIVLV